MKRINNILLDDRPGAFSKYYSGMPLTLSQAQRISDVLADELGIISVRVEFCQHLIDDSNGLYCDDPARILLNKRRAKLSTLLHEIGHHLQHQAYDFMWGDTVHGATFGKAIRRVVTAFRRAYDDPNFIYISGRMILEPKNRRSK